ncbi:hypothetical protein [Streptomyces xinghaiensis]|uniref:hypothetical protein n=1 Tax=Streptomyces xinghaiensis TaxID=1038928 RepID=UPI0002F6D105|nr:hypothetical protein [Streptomyces xinghaiensis]
MAPPSATPTARKRRSKTRTPQVNHRPPITVSTLKPNHIDLSPGKEHLVCPDCRTWCPITGMQGTPKLVPHHNKPAGTANPRRCTAGSNRRVDIDLSVGEWRTGLVEAVPTTNSRRATKVLPKPKTTRLPAVGQIKPVPLSAETVRQAFRRHQQQCRACGQAFQQHRPARESGTTGRDGQPLPCHHGERLAAAFLRLLRQEPKRRAVREAFARERRRFDRRYTDPKTRTSQWAAVLPAVEAADAQRTQLPAGDPPTEGPAVPLITLRPEPPVS